MKPLLHCPVRRLRSSAKKSRSNVPTLRKVVVLPSPLIFATHSSIILTLVLTLKLVLIVLVSLADACEHLVFLQITYNSVQNLKENIF